MDQIKIGAFIRDLRKEKELTQEQLAEEFNVSRRTVSRWETGSNVPDLDLLLELSDYFQVDLRELLDGERRPAAAVETPEATLEETVKKVAEYSQEDKAKLTRLMLVYFAAGLVCLVINQAMNMMELPSTFWVGFLEGSTSGLAAAAMVMGILYATGLLTKVMEAKRRLLGLDRKDQ